MRQTNNLVDGMIRRPAEGKGRFASIKGQTVRDGKHMSLSGGYQHKMSKGEPLWKTDGLNTLNFLTGYAFYAGSNTQAGAAFEGGPGIQEISTAPPGHPRVHVHHVGGAQGVLPDMSKIQIYLSPKTCTDSANLMTIPRIPHSLIDFYSLIGCSREQASGLATILVTLETGDAVIPESWFSLVRWLRSRLTVPSAILVVDKNKRGNFKYYPRIVPACIWTEPKWKKNDIRIGTPWCTQFGGKSPGYIHVFNPLDNDLAEKLPKEDFVKFCINIRLGGGHISVTYDQTCDENNLRTVYAARKGPGSNFCVGKSATREISSFGLGVNCTEDEFEHEASFFSPAAREKGWMRRVCVKDGLTSLDCDEHDQELIWGFSDDIKIQAKTNKICVSNTTPLTKIGCESDLAVKIKFPVIEDVPDAWCIGLLTGSYVVCMQKGACHDRCETFATVRSASLNDIPINQLFFKRD